MEAKTTFAIIFIVLLIFASASIATAEKSESTGDGPMGPDDREETQQQNQTGPMYGNGTSQQVQNQTGPNENCTSEQAKVQTQNQTQNGPGYENGTQYQNKTQEQVKNGTCDPEGNMTQTKNQTQNGPGYGNGTQYQNKTQEQTQNGTCDTEGNKTQTQNQNQNGGTGNGSESNGGEGTANQNKEQNKDGGGAQNQEENQEGGTGNGQTGKNEGSGDGNGSGTEQKKQYQYGKDDNDQTKNQWKYQYRNQIQNAIKNGTVVQECNISKKDGNVYMNSYEYQKGMDVEIEEQSQNMIQVRVQAEFKEGKVLVLNIQKNALKVESANQIRIRFDNQEISQGSVEDVLDGEGNQAQYAMSVGESGGQYLVYIPHFSEHTISIEALNGLEPEKVQIPLNALVGALLTIVLLAMVVVRLGKYRR